MNPGPTFDRVYGETRRRLLSGNWLPGQHIDLQLLADSLGASITPVRDALYRLVGEGLLTLGLSDGFAAPTITEPDLRDRYDWSQMVLALCLRKSGQPSVGRLVDTGTSPAESIADLFEGIARQAGNFDRSAAIASVNDRLSTARIAETRIGLATHDEAASLWRRAAESDMATLKSEIARYHRRRMQMAGRIVQAMHRPD